MEKIIKPVSGFFTLLLSLLGIAFGIFLMVITQEKDPGAAAPLIGTGVFVIVASLFLTGGLVIVNPNQAFACTFFGKYRGTIKENGLRFVNPLYRKRKVSLRANNFESAKLKVNDKLG